MSQKKINYLSRTFDDYRSELITFSNKYYPELADSYNDSSVGSWFIDLVSAVGDNLSYHIDRMYQETNLNSANLRSTVLNIARTNGLKVPGPKASMCEVKISCDLPSGDLESGSISSPNWSLAPILKRTSVVSAGNINFQLTEDVDFASQFNKDGYSNRTFVPKRNTNGVITAYTVSKTTLVVNGSTRIFKKVMSANDIKPFMEIVLPEKNVMNVESIIFKESSNYNLNPDVSEFYVNAERYKVHDSQAADTFRYFEVDSLVEQYLYLPEVSFVDGEDSEGVIDFYNPDVYEDYSETVYKYYKDGNYVGLCYKQGDNYYLSNGTLLDPNIYTFSTEYESQRTTRYYRGKWKPIKQKFITEYTDNGYLKIIFGAGANYEEVPNVETKFSERTMSNIINNDMLGVLPREGWSMFILYRVGGGISSNLGEGAINSISMAVTEFKTDYAGENAASERGKVINSLTVTNTSPAIAGKDSPSTAEVKYLVKYNTHSQGRCVTVKDYKNRLMLMPPKYGAPFRASVVEDNNKILMSLLNINSNGKLMKALPDVLVDNIIEYMSHYKTLGDYIEIKSGKIYNLGITLELFIEKTYDTPTVLTNVIETIKEYMSIQNHDIGEDIFVGDLEKEITSVDGVVAIIDFSVYSVYNGTYSSDRCPLPEDTSSEQGCTNSSSITFKVNGSEESFKIDLKAIDNVLYSDFNSMFEILNDNDIQVKCKLV